MKSIIIISLFPPVALPKWGQIAPKFRIFGRFYRGNQEEELIRISISDWESESQVGEAMGWKIFYSAFFLENEAFNYSN